MCEGTMQPIPMRSTAALGRDTTNAPMTEFDRHFVQRCVAQEAGVWEAFVDRYAGLFVRVVQHTAHCRSVTVTADDVDDLCSDIFLAVLANDFAVLRNFRGQSELSTYLTVVARRVVVRELSKRRMAEAMGHVKVHAEALEQSGQNGDRVESRELVDLMLSGLSEREAGAVRQYHLEGRSYHEISASLGLPENSIGPLLSRAREKLRHSGVAAE